MKIRKILFPVIIFVVLMLVLAFGTYNILNNAIIDITASYIDELAQHDMKNIKDFISGRFKSMNSICDEIRVKDSKISTVEDVQHELNIKTLSEDFDHLYLIDSEGRLYSDTYVITEKEENPFLTFFENGSSEFASRYNDTSRFHEYKKEYMIYGLNFADNPIEVTGNVKFVGMLLLNDISKIRESLRITSFDGRGYNSVIDGEGYYIVSDGTSAAINQVKNFYEMVRNGEIDDMTADEIIDTIDRGESISFWYVNENGERRFVSVKPIVDSDWKFINSVEASVFTEQATTFILLMTGVAVAMLFIVVVILLVIYISRQKVKKLYSSVVEGVYNKQYYHDKLSDKQVRALVIIDLDHLKSINDNYGHMAGDAAIEKMARVFVNNVGGLANIFRFGGDEFVIIFEEEVAPGEFLRLINNILNDIREAEIEQFPDIKLTISAGGYYCEETELASKVLNKADGLLYEAKKTRDCSVTNLVSKNADGTNSEKEREN